MTVSLLFLEFEMDSLSSQGVTFVANNGLAKDAQCAYDLSAWINHLPQSVIWMHN